MKIHFTAYAVDVYACEREESGGGRKTEREVLGLGGGVCVGWVGPNKHVGYVKL